MRERVKLTANILFSGIGCQERGFRDSDLFNIEVLNTSDISKESVLSYAAIHCGMTNEMVDTYVDYPSREEMTQYLTDINLGYEPEKNKYFDWFKLIKRKKNDLEKYWLACKLVHNLGDISRIEELSYADFWTCSFPCTDISVAGKMKGLNPESGTRSGLLWENIRLLSKAKDNNRLPKYIMFENVKNLVSKKFINDFRDLLEVLDELGFNSYWSVINGKDCGVPQSRERVFVISVRKDIDKGRYTFPKPFDVGIRLKNILEKEVEDKYYLSSETVSRLYNNGQGYHSKISIKDDAQYSATLLASMYKNARGIDLIGDDENTLKQIGYLNNYNGDANRVYSTTIARTLKSEAGGGGAKTGWYKTELGIRKLTPRECWKLMGLTFEDCDKAREIGVADTHLYKQAGNGIITNCCALLAEHLYKAQYDNTYICTDERYQENFIKPQVK